MKERKGGVLEPKRVQPPYANLHITPAVVTNVLPSENVALMTTV
jgi:hypothetical protein